MKKNRIISAIAIGAISASAAVTALAAPAPGFYIGTQHLNPASIKKTVDNYGAGAIKFVPPAAKRHSMPFLKLGGVPKPQANALVKSVIAKYSAAKRPFVLTISCFGTPADFNYKAAGRSDLFAYSYSVNYTPGATTKHQIWINTNGEAMVNQVFDECPAQNLFIAISH